MCFKKFFLLLLASVSLFCLVSCDYFPLFSEGDGNSSHVVAEGTPEENYGLGNPSGAGLDDCNNYLMVKQGYAVSYNDSLGFPNWSSWHLDFDDLGSLDREDSFRADEDLPEGFNRITKDDYTNSGFDRGHLCPNADRNGNEELQRETFLMTNMVPQAPNNNRNTWAALENHARNLVKEGYELYIVAGAYDDPDGDGGEGSKGFVTFYDKDGDGLGITIPEYVWKVMFAIEDGSDDIARADLSNSFMLAVWIPNTQECSDRSWYEYAVSVDDVERLTGYDFFSMLDDDLEVALEKTVYETAG